MDFSKGNSKHKIKRMNVIKPKEEKKKKEAQAKGKKHVPEDDDDVEMDDPSSPMHKTSTAGSSRGKKKLSWWQHTLLCMNVAIHKENYVALKRGRPSFTIKSPSSMRFSLSKTPLLSFLLFLLSPPTLRMLSGKTTMAWIGLSWRLLLRVMTSRRSPKTMRMGPMMSDLLVGSSIALLPFWCLDAKGGEVVLFRICFGLGCYSWSYLPLVS
jgi:hypothetical protein